MNSVALAVLRSRLFQFFAVGALVWAFAPARHREREVVVDSSVVADALRSEQARVARPLTLEEKQRVVGELVEAEVLLREGLRLGIGADDPVVRGRIADRMRGHLEAAAPATVTPDEAREEAARRVARMPVRVRLSIAFISKERPNAASDADALARLLATSPETPAPYGGDRAPIEANEWWREEDLTRAAGASVARAALDTRIGSWSAPIASAWGFYVIRPVERRAPTAAEATDSAAAEVRRRKSAEAVARAVARVTSDYDVTVRSPPGEPAFDLRSMANAREATRARGRADGVD